MRGYTRDHTWVVVRGNEATVGISDFAQAELGEIAYVELPELGRTVQRGEVVCTVDSLKSSSEIYAPLSGTIIARNEALTVEETCTLVNTDPLGEGWLFVLTMSNPAEVDLLVPEEEYLRSVKTE